MSVDVQKMLRGITDAPQANYLVMASWAQMLDKIHPHGIFGGQVMLLARQIEDARQFLDPEGTTHDQQ